jgi:hypothetical protein
MIPLDQRRRLAELYGDNPRDSDVQPDPYTDALAAQHDQEYKPELAPPTRCDECTYRLDSIGHQVQCGGVS